MGIIKRKHRKNKIPQENKTPAQNPLLKSVSPVSCEIKSNVLPVALEPYAISAFSVAIVVS